MIDIQILRENPDLIRNSLIARGDDVALVDAAIAAEQNRRDTIAAFEELRAAQNAHGKLVAAAPKDEKAALVAAAQELSAKVKEAQSVASDADAASTAALSRIGNIIIDGVPSGGEADFVTLKEVGVKPTFDFEARDHLEIGEGEEVTDSHRVRYARQLIETGLKGDDGYLFVSVHSYPLIHRDGREAILGCSVETHGQAGDVVVCHGAFPSRREFWAALTASGYLLLSEVESLTDSMILELWK